MTEFDYICKERASLARQSKYRKRGSKSKKCTLGSDRMTLKQWKERNGSIMSLNMNLPYDNWEEFKKLSKDTQKEYIIGLYDKYHINCQCLSEMFGACKATIRKYLTEELDDLRFKRGDKMSFEERKTWNEFLGKEMSTESCDATSTPGAILSPDPIKLLPLMCMDNFSLSFSGRIDLESIMNSLRFMLPDQAFGEMEIIFRSTGK